MVEDVSVVTDSGPIALSEGGIKRLTSLHGPSNHHVNALACERSGDTGERCVLQYCVDRQ